MRSLCTLLFGLLVVSLTPAAHADEKAFTPARLSSIEASGGIRLEVTAGEERRAVLSGTPDELKQVTVRETGTGLVVQRHCMLGCGRNRPGVVLHVTSPELASFRFSRGVEAKVDGVTADRVDIIASQGVELAITGRCGQLVLKGTMGADIDASGLQCRSVEATGAMGADIAVFALEHADANASMGGDIQIHGPAPDLKSHASLGGSVQRE